MSHSNSDNRKKIKKNKIFKHYWLDDVSFKTWLVPDKNSKYKAKCKVCDVTINSRKSELQKHSKTCKHIENMNKNIDQMFKSNQNNTHQENIKKAEIMLAALFAANNVAFSFIDQLEMVLKKIFPDSKICQDVNIKRTKCVEIIKSVLCKKETNDLKLHLRNHNFSIMLDESTDIGDCKSLAILTRYLKNNKIETRLLELLQLDARNLVATDLYNAFKSWLEKHEIPLHNLIGVASDNASVMVGPNYSFFKLLKNYVPHVVLIRYICHSASLVASSACSVLPRIPEELIRSVYTCTSGSAKTSAQLQEMHEYFNENKQKMLKLATTRWLSRYECVLRLLAF